MYENSENEKPLTPDLIGFRMNLIVLQLKEKV